LAIAPARHLSIQNQCGYNSHIEKGEIMRSVNVAKLKNSLSKYLGFAKSGEEIVIRDRNLPVAKLVPFTAEGADDLDIALVAASKMRLPKSPLNIRSLLRIPTDKVDGSKATEALLADRNESEKD
jgi:antitoxin (DNA-binding transcriptional repressor) of toxin-antitoxin stability system